jgi:hypothetical protein
MAVPLFVLEYWTKLQCIQMVLLTIILRVISSYCTPFIGYWTTAGTFPNLPVDTAHFGEISVEIAEPGILAQYYPTFWRTFGGNLA